MSIRRKKLSDFCNSTSRESVEEAGYAVCGKLVLISDMVLLKEANCNLKVLSHQVTGITRSERHSLSEKIEDLEGPVLDRTCNHICKSC